MKKELSLVLRTIYLTISFAFLAAALLCPEKFYPEGGFDHLLRICFFLCAPLSMPLNFLTLFVVGTINRFWSLTNSPREFTYLMFLVSIATGYFQWFVLFPRFLQGLRKTTVAATYRMVPSLKSAHSKALNEARISAWQTNWYDQQKPTPVERLFDKDKE